MLLISRENTVKYFGHWLRHDEMKHLEELLAAPILVHLQDLIWQASPCVIQVERFDTDVKVECVLVEENRAARIVGHMKSFTKNIVINIVRCFLQGNNKSFPSNLFLKCVFPPTSGPGFQL